MLIDPSVMASTFATVRAYKPPKCILSLEVRKALHKMGWTEIHYSDLSRGSECGYMQFLDIIRSQDTGMKQHGAKKRMSAHALLGSVSHEAFENYEDTIGVQADGVTQLGLDPWYWRMLFKKVMSRDENTVYQWNGADVNEMDIERWSNMLASRKTYGVTLAEIFRSTTS